ncbi:MurR/RpiR family transcriptional regulator [Albirhodobacter sp. R86504]|uniref:MurR/RpiR family transcriptional regulator n=1 Tax=Albirhodobacter sp. R86504 TaxID=3093848 RepID=UPI003672530B
MGVEQLDQEVTQAPVSIPQLLERLDQFEGTFPKRLRQCAACLRANLGSMAVLTVAEVASAADVAPSAVMRFCQALGFSGYSEMQALFRADFTPPRPAYAERLTSLRRDGGQGAAQLLEGFVDAAQGSLNLLMMSEAGADIDRAARIAADARTVHLVGIRRAYSVVSYMGYTLQQMDVPCMSHAGTLGTGYTSAIQSGDVVIAVTFAPFARETAEVVEAAYTKGVPVVLITDTPDCPLGDRAGVLLLARDLDNGSFRVPVAAMALAAALVVSIGSLRAAE